MFRIYAFILTLITPSLLAQTGLESDFDVDEPILHIHQQFKKKTIGRYVSVLKCENKPSLAKIMRDSINYPFKLNYTDVLQFKTDKSDRAFWLAFRLKNDTERQQNLFLEADNPLLNEVEFFEISNQERFSNHNATGSKFEFQTRQIPHRNFIFRINLEPKEEKIYYVYIHHHQSSFQVPLVVYHPETFALQNYQIQTTLGIFVGFLIFASLTIFFFYLHLQKQIFLFLLLYLVSIMGWILSKNGFAFQYLWSKNPTWNENASHFFAFLSAYVMAKILRFFIAEQKNSPFLPRILNFVAYVCLSVLVLSLVLMYFGSPLLLWINGSWIFDVLFFGQAIFDLILIYYLIQKPNSNVFYMLLAIVLFLLPVFQLYRLGEQLSENLYAQPFFLYLVALQVLLLMLILTYRVRFFKNEEHLQKLISVNKMIALYEQKEKEMIE
jgi:hypothetical protein